MNRSAILRALSRFDVATVADIATATGAPPNSVWKQMQRLVRDGAATREGERGQVARYRMAQQQAKAA